MNDVNSKLSKLCDGLLEASWLAAVISIPLFFNIHSERVFEPDKLTLMRSLAVFMAAIWIVKFIDQKGWQQFRRLSWRNERSFWRLPFVLPIAALLLVYLISTLFSITPRVSWAGSYQRLQGTYTMLAYVVIGGITASTIRSRAQIGRLVTAVILSSLPVAFYGLLQRAGQDPLPWGGDVTRRVAGQMGNAIFIAAYLIMVVPLTLSRIVDAFTNILSDEILSYADVIRSGIYIFLFGAQLIVIYWSGSRGPLIALAVGLFSFMLVLLVSLRNAAAGEQPLQSREVGLAFLFLLPAVLLLLLSHVIMQVLSPLAAFALFMGIILISVLGIFLFLALRQTWRWLWLSWLLLTVFVGGWLLLFNIPEPRMRPMAELPLVGSLFETQLAWKELPVVGTYGRMLDPSQTSGREKSNRVRVLIWQGVVDLLTPHEPLEYPDGSSDRYNFLRPLIGYGPESMYQAYNRFYPPELATVEARNASPDRSHNETFDALVITGLAGFLAWQALYISVFYYGFRYLGVVTSRRDRNVLLGLYIGGGLLGGLLSITLIDPIYFGVLVPTGIIVGLILYLFYYALFGRRAVLTGQDVDEAQSSPFYVDRLLMNALLAAVVAHYVEIHFGIAISATRMYFFLYIAAMYLISVKLPRLREMRTTEESATRKRRQRSRTSSAPVFGSWGLSLMWSFLLALTIGILGYEFMNYVLPEAQQVASGVDLTTADIFRQSLFVNAQRGFAPSPYIYVLLVITWALGALLVLSEMVKRGLLKLPSQDVAPPSRQKTYLAAGVFTLLALAGFVNRFLLAGVQEAPANLGSTVAYMGAVIFLWAAAFLLLELPAKRVVPLLVTLGGLLLSVALFFTVAPDLDLILGALALAVMSLWVLLHPLQAGSAGRLAALCIACAGLLFSLPLIVAGVWIFGLTLALLCAAILILLWEKSSGAFLLPALVLGGVSWLIGLAFTYLHALNLREALLYLIFYQDIEPVSSLYTLFFRPTASVSSVPQLRVLEAVQSMRFLSWFYMFLFAMVLLAGLSLAWRSISASRRRGSAVAYAALFALLLGTVIVVNLSNVRVVQADMVYKRGKPFDEQGMRQNDPLGWDIAIAIYEKALELAPWEDYYYLFLGRAYLERANTAADASEASGLYQTARDLLQQAQSLNPLNTDHTANLARLYTRWYAIDPESDRAPERLEAAEQYYQDALQLSPQNSIIRNEYARLVIDLKNSCDRALAIYDESLTIDPFYATTYFEMTDALVACAAAQEDESARAELYGIAAETLSGGLERQPNNVRGWLKLGQVRQQLGLNEAALEAFEEARGQDLAGTIPSWNIDFIEASIYEEMGDIDMALALAEQALRSAPANAAAEIETFIDGLNRE